jgi:predicted negative regulator of RcsB-dependent stress response
VEALEEIQSGADRLAEWIRDHLWIVVGALIAVLVIAGGFQLALSAGEKREMAASTALAEARSAYLEAMGAPTGSLEVPELANPEAGKRIRAEFAVRFGEVADAHSGTVSGALARLEAGNLLAESGDLSGASEVWRSLLSEAPRHDELRGLILQRLAHAHEDAGQWREAAERHEEASALSGFPLRHWALADAVRCFAAAGDNERATALYERLQTLAPELRLPEHQRAQFETLRALAAD